MNNPETQSQRNRNAIGPDYQRVASLPSTDGRLREGGEPRSDRPQDGEGHKAAQAGPHHLRQPPEGE
eukprot:8677939-Pyramimonas_sp.AAC.1